ncbi:MAG: ABC transporter substrate-binding protein [Candidatus Caldatribacteriota bacterium]
MNKVFILFLSGLLLIFSSFVESASPKTIPLGMAVEFTDHAACAYVSLDKGWFKEDGLDINSYESYATGMALASALARGDIQVAYMCLVPAINVFANAKVPIRIVTGTHKYGYGLVVNPEKIKNLKDLEAPGIHLGCVQEGGAVDVLLHKMMDKYNLNDKKIINNIQRMNPAKQILAIQTKQLEAAFLPEHWATLATELGFKMLLISQELWPEMQGSVLVIKEELIRDYPEIVEKLIKISQKATDWINQYPRESAEILVRQLQMNGEDLLPKDIVYNNQIKLSSDLLFRSMNRLKYTTEINPSIVQETIDYIAQLGYIKRSFRAEDILDLSFIGKQ